MYNTYNSSISLWVALAYSRIFFLPTSNRQGRYVCFPLKNRENDFHSTKSLSLFLLVFSFFHNRKFFYFSFLFLLTAFITHLFRTSSFVLCVVWFFFVKYFRVAHSTTEKEVREREENDKKDRSLQEHLNCFMYWTGIFVLCSCYMNDKKNNTQSKMIFVIKKLHRIKKIPPRKKHFFNDRE